MICRLVPCFLALASTLAAADTAATPNFYAPGLVDAGRPFELSVAANRGDVTGWKVQWGDGAEAFFDTTSPTLTHTYAKPGPYAVTVAAQLADGTRVPAALDYSRLIGESHPLFYQRSSVSPLASSSAATNETAAVGPTDRFSAEFWIRPTDLHARRQIVGTEKSRDAAIYLDHGNLDFKPSAKGLYVQPLPKLAPGTWHHLAVTYDRSPLFPYQNSARFYCDGILLGEQHLDLYDTGAVICPKGNVQSSRGDIAELALYASDLPPHRILQHARLLYTPGTLAVFASAPVVEPFTVDLPKITQTVSVPLDPAPNVDNGPALRQAVKDALPGTRLVLVDKKTGKSGSTFHVNTLDGGNDWSAIRLFDRHDLEIDGGGATLVFALNCQQFYLRNCQRIALRNFAIDLDQTKYRVGVYARILSLDKMTGDIRFQFVNGRNLSPDRTVPRDIGMWRWRPHNPKTLRIVKGPSFKTGEALTGPPKRDPQDPSILVGQLQPGMIKEMESYRQGPNFFMVNNANFSNKCICCSGGEQLTFDHLSFYADLGMVFLSNGFHHLQVTNCRIGLPPGLTAADRPLASGADGFHFHETQGEILFEHNEIALTDDDPISLKDGVWQNLQVLDGHAIHMPGANVGDEIELFNWDFSPLNYRAHVVSETKGDIVLDLPLPATLPKSFIGMDHVQHTSNWILADNDLHDYYGRLLLYTPHGLIRGNRIEHSWLHLGAADVSFESDGISSAVTVYDNYLVDTNADTGIWGPSSKYPVFQNIAYVFNSFLGQGLVLNNADSPWVVGNYFEPRAPKEEKQPQTHTLEVATSVAPFISDNFQLATQPGDFSFLLKNSDSVIQQNNTVLVSPVESRGTY